MTIAQFTISGHAYTSYITVEEADIFLAIDPSRRTAWEALTAEAKQRHLIAATNRLDVLNWQGSKAAASQATEWPRTGLTYPDGSAVPSDSIPDRIERATALLAGSIEADSTHATVPRPTRQTSAVKAGTVEVRFATGEGTQTQGPVYDAQLQDLEVHELVKLWLRVSTTATGRRRMVSATACPQGTDGESEFTDQQLGYGRSRGFA